jgi:predicted transcriptional regulator of viral defense system
VVASRVWAPCYFSGWTAARQWNLTEQVFLTTILKTSARVRESEASLLDHNYLVGHVSPAALSWGLMTEWRGESRLRFASPARTVVEILDRPKIGGGLRQAGDVLTAYFEDSNPAELVETGDRFGNRAVFKRLGYLVETLGLDQAGLLAACAERVSSGISALDPDGPAGGRRVMRWGLRVNATVVREGAS